MVNLNKLSLYIHIPFCIKRCQYCDFYSVTGAGTTLVNSTLDAILTSLDISLSTLKPGTVSTVFIGGGTPSLISPSALEQFLIKLNTIVGRVEEFTIEVNPESLSRDFLEVLSANFVNRISMGVQTYDEYLLSWLGRPAGVDALERAESLLDEYWKGRLSRDLLAALPGVTDTDVSGRLLKDIKRALSINSESKKSGHLSLYELTVEDGTPLAGNREGLKALPDESSSRIEWETALGYLRDRGYKRYEVSNFAAAGEESKHNMTYWRMQPYLGVGPGAASTIPGIDNQIIRRQEPRDLFLWLSDPTGTYSESSLTPAELALEHFMMGLRISEGLSVRHFKNIFGISPSDAVPESIRRWENTGVLISDSESLKASAKGMDMLDSVLIDIASEADNVHWQSFCRWPQP